MKKNKIIILASIIIGVLVVTLGLTYAAITFNETKGNSELVLGDIWMHYGETNQLVLSDAMPMDINDYITYKVNPVMKEQEVVDNELFRCINYFNNRYSNFEKMSTIETFCKGTGTIMQGTTLQQFWDNAYQEEGFMEQDGNIILNNNIMILENGTYIANPIMATQSLNELSRCINYYYRYEFDEGSDVKSFCKGTGTAWDGLTIQEDLYDWIKSNGMVEFLTYGGQELLDASIVFEEIENLPYFEFTIDGKNTYTKKDIWYEIVLNHGAEHETRSTRIRDDLLRFTLVEIEDGNNTVLFNDRKYSDLTNKKIYVDTILANTNEEVNRTYRLYMWISKDTVIGNVNEDYSIDEWNDVFASIKVNVTGDFIEKELTYEDMYDITDERCFETEETTVYTRNMNITDSEVSMCVTYLTNTNGEEFEVGSYDRYCRGLGEINGYTFDEELALNYLSDDGIIYFVENNIINATEGLSIINYDDSCDKEVVIPQTINGKKVIQIDDWAFGDENLTNVVFSNNVLRIDKNSFLNNYISMANIPSSVALFSCDAFDNDVYLKFENNSLKCFRTPF